MEWLSRTLCPLQAVHGQRGRGPLYPLPSQLQACSQRLQEPLPGVPLWVQMAAGIPLPTRRDTGAALCWEDGQSLTMWTGVFMCKASQCAAWSQGGAPPEPQGT